jgi:hypothetical protein
MDPNLRYALTSTLRRERTDLLMVNKHYYEVNSTRNVTYYYPLGYKIRADRLVFNKVYTGEPDAKLDIDHLSFGYLGVKGSKRFFKKWDLYKITVAVLMDNGFGAQIFVGAQVKRTYWNEVK